MGAVCPFVCLCTWQFTPNPGMCPGTKNVPVHCARGHHVVKHTHDRGHTADGGTDMRRALAPLPV